MDEFADQAFDARLVIGPKFRDFEQKLACASSFEERACVASAFLLECLTERSGGDAVAAVANRFCPSGACSASETRRRRPGSACANSSAGSANRSAFLRNSTPASSGSTPRLKPRRARRDDYGPTSRTISAITTRCTWSGISKTLPARSDGLHPALGGDAGVVGLMSHSYYRGRPGHPVDWRKPIAGDRSLMTNLHAVSEYSVAEKAVGSVVKVTAKPGTLTT